MRGKRNPHLRQFPRIFAAFSDNDIISRKEHHTRVESAVRAENHQELTICSIKRSKLFFTGFFRVLKTRAPTPPPALVIKRLFLAREQKIRWKNVFLFFIGHEVLFYETTFSASALEH
jgi:hypothetical protein